MSRRKRIAIGAVAGLTVAAAALWYWQSHIIGIGARWKLEQVAAREEANGSLEERRRAVHQMNRLLLLNPPPDVLVPELYDLITAVSPRVATGEIDYAWAAYVYNSYERDLATDRPQGVPRRTMPEVQQEVQRYVEFYALQKRPDVDGIRLRDLTEEGSGESFTLEEIEKAEREGRDLTRGE